MTKNLLNIDYDSSADNQLVEALANIWFQMLILGVLLMGVLSGIAFGIEIWRWPVALAVPIVAWWFGTWYGKFNAGEENKSHL
jgi:hypothetical protein